MNPADNEIQVYEEWRVTADHHPDSIIKSPPYDFTWSHQRNPHLMKAGMTPEFAARKFIEQVEKHSALINVKLFRRVVTITAWEEQDGPERQEGSSEGPDTVPGPRQG